MGKILVDQLGLEDSTDILSRWMAHYLAEKMALIETAATEQKKEDARVECFDVILKLWKQRWSFPEGKQPLRSYEHLLEVLEKLSPDNRDPFYSTVAEFKRATLAEGKTNLTPEQQFDTQIMDVDRGARACIKYLLKQAALTIDNDTTKQFLEAGIDLPDKIDIQLMIALSDDRSEDENELDDQAQVKRYEIGQLKKDIGRLETLAKVNEQVLEGLKQRLSALDVF